MPNRIYYNKSKPIQYINRIPYLVHAEIEISQVKDIALVKEWLNADIAFKNDKMGVYYFCSEIKEAEIV